MGLVASQYMGASWIRDQTRVPCIGRQILNHWTTREFQNMKDNILFFFFNIFYLYLIFVSLINMCLSVFLFKFFYFIINLFILIGG